ncbi:monocarboxylate transporter 12-B-like protein [Lates japonicus]|uniref:Monocarboxylate transporter 12-B-like protein n=1 Tax=Lates japonicus TaxID=270547 RepID=A0AAD3RHP0_LATJO|nr:monocarboxylate transporter 12-B-like protein [Lates japonicus]
MQVRLLVDGGVSLPSRHCFALPTSPFAILHGYSTVPTRALIPVVTPDVVERLHCPAPVWSYSPSSPTSPARHRRLAGLMSQEDMATFFPQRCRLLATILSTADITAAGAATATTTVAMETKHEPLPQPVRPQSDCFMAFNKEAAGQAVALVVSGNTNQIHRHRHRRQQRCDWTQSQVSIK